ncbi:hypothetical protein MnTg02_00827 [bacterium MnTg02]|nr:hypothetical protein MnTg02_00827 [bacterium MnTg02]
MAPYPGVGESRVLDKRRKRDFRVKPVIGNDSRNAAGGERGTDETVSLAAASFPSSTVKKNGDRPGTVTGLRPVDIELVAAMRAIFGPTLNQDATFRNDRTIGSLKRYGRFEAAKSQDKERPGEQGRGESQAETPFSKHLIWSVC